MQLFRVIKTPFVMVIIDNLPDDANYELAESKIRSYHLILTLTKQTFKMF